MSSQSFVQKVGDKVYNAEYEVKGDTLVVTCNGTSREDKLEYLQPLYKARDLLREIVRETEKG